MTSPRLFLLKVNASECPGEIGRPHDSSDWEGKIFKAGTPQKTRGGVELSPEQNRSPDPGDHLLIWVNDWDGRGAGLTASGEVASLDLHSIELVPKRVELFSKPHLNSADLRNPMRHPALNDIARSRVVALRYLTREDWTAITDAAAKKVAMAIRQYVSITAEEGKRIYSQSVKLERDPKISLEVKERNKLLHGGTYKCEACAFSESRSSLFDAHHLFPLYLGPRETSLRDFAVLCPTCHRLAHRLGVLHDPLSVSEIKKWWQERGPDAPSTSS